MVAIINITVIIQQVYNSGGMYNSLYLCPPSHLVIVIAQDGQGFMPIVNKPHPQATPSDSVCLLP